MSDKKEVKPGSDEWAKEHADLVEKLAAIKKEIFDHRNPVVEEVKADEKKASDKK
jgi:hypothetical protein